MDPRYPIGKYEPVAFSEHQKKQWLIDLAQLPAMMEAAIQNLDDYQLQTPYREGGWTVHQVVHHVADSHLNAYCRMKLTLAEDNPTIKAYNENDWVMMADASLPINNALTLLHALHQRLYKLMEQVSAEDWNRFYTHSGTGLQHTLWHLFGLYAWHGRHHVAHINALREKNNW